MACQTALNMLRAVTLPRFVEGDLVLISKINGTKFSV